MTAPPSSILILGAGELGSAILTALTTTTTNLPSPPPKIAILQRRPSPQPPKGVALETADLTNTPIPQLAGIFRKYHTVIQAAGYGAPRGTLLRVAQAAVDAGVPRFFPWQFGVDYAAISASAEGGGVEGSGHGELFGEMLAVRALLAGQQRTEWKVVSTGLFMDFLFLRGFGVVNFAERTLRALGGWGNAVTVTDVRGIGSVVAELVYRPGDGSGVVYVAGDTVSYGQVADVVEGVYGGEWRREVWDREELRRRLEEQPGDLMLKYQNVFGAGVGLSWERERTVNYQRGIKTAGLREYVEENKDRLAEVAE